LINNVALAVCGIVTIMAQQFLYESFTGLMIYGIIFGSCLGKLTNQNLNSQLRSVLISTAKSNVAADVLKLPRTEKRTVCHVTRVRSIRRIKRSIDR
jgi:hypothetical protein